MKARMNDLKRICLSALILSTVGYFSSCSPAKQEEKKETAPETEVTEAIPSVSAAYTPDSVFSKQLNGVYVAYLGLKDALVASDVEASRMAAAGMGKALSVVNPDLLTGAARNDWNSFFPEIGRSLRTISSAATLEAGRAEFSNLSEGLWKVISAFGSAGAPVYRDYCPMALNNKGAYWLSSTEEIRNPYFGESMLDCGSVRQKMN